MTRRTPTTTLALRWRQINAHFWRARHPLWPGVSDFALEVRRVDSADAWVVVSCHRRVSDLHGTAVDAMRAASAIVWRELLSIAAHDGDELDQHNAAGLTQAIVAASVEAVDQFHNPTEHSA